MSTLIIQHLVCTPFDRTPEHSVALPLPRCCRMMPAAWSPSDLVRGIAERGAVVPLLVLLTARPEAPEELRRRQLGALTAWALASARIQPVVLACEDLHWADPTTLDVVRGIAERGAVVPLLALLTARPEFRQPWGTRSHHGMISLAPLDRNQVQLMVAEIAARHVLSKEVVEGVSEPGRWQAAICSLPSSGIFNMRFSMSPGGMRLQRRPLPRR